MILRINIHQMCTNIRYVDGFRVYASCSANSNWPETIWRFLKQCTFLVGRMLRCICMAWEAVTTPRCFDGLPGGVQEYIDSSMLLFPSRSAWPGCPYLSQNFSRKNWTQYSIACCRFWSGGTGWTEKIGRSTTQHSGSWVYNSWSKISWHTRLPTLRILGRTHCEK